MGGFKPEQRRFVVDGRTFHFVAYEASPESRAQHRAAEPAMWCLMVEGRRCPVAPWLPDQAEESVDRLLLQWLRTNVVTGFTRRTVVTKLS